MAKPPGVVKLRHHKEPHLEVHLFQDQQTLKVTGHCIDWRRGKVTSFSEQESEEGGQEWKQR